MTHSLNGLLVALLAISCSQLFAQVEVPHDLQGTLTTFCADCHSGSEPDGALRLDGLEVDWDDPTSLKKWELVHTMVSKGIMPPPESEPLPDAESTALLEWLHLELESRSPVGGTPLRRLSAREYANTIRSLFKLPKFELPQSFPPDNGRDGFDNQGSELVIAVSHLGALADTATAVADEFFGPSRSQVESQEFAIPADDLVISYSSACLIDGTMRLASSGNNIIRNATWPSRFEAPAHGRYTIEVTASAFRPDETLPNLRVSSMTADRSLSKVLGNFELSSASPKPLLIEATLDRGETIVMQYTTGPLNYDDKKSFENYLREFLADEPKLAAAWASVGNPPRGGSGWERVKEAMISDDLNPTAYGRGSEAVAKMAKKLASKNVDTGETLVYRFFEKGPAIAIHAVRITGPHECFVDRDDVRIERQRKRFLGSASDATRADELDDFFDEFLSQAFRRPATESEIDSYLEIVRRETNATHDINRGLHLALRTALISPTFLYRNLSDGTQTDFALASRLAYFLTSGPPDQKLVDIAATGRLADTKTLVREANRIISPRFTRDFTTQWLGLEVLDNLMPDTRLIRKFTSSHRETMRKEVEATFQHVLDNNLPVRELISPDFLLTDALVGWEIYELDQFRPAKKAGKSKRQKKLQQVAIDRDGRRGGLLSMPAVMMATANGVDTQPVLRGVWVLENILGSPPPDPPNAVPALTPDITGASTPKGRLAAHMASDGCAVCHREIDPLGFVLENYDPIGRWRDHYPRYLDQPTGRAKVENGAKVDTQGVLPNGVPLSDVTDLKQWLAENPEPFARCLSEKLMTYATGRELSFRERAMIAKIVRQNVANEYRLRDLMLTLIDSDIFRKP